MLLLRPDELVARRDTLHHSPTLQGLARRLRGYLQPVLDAPVSPPQEKPRLTREGGVCAADGARLLFHPLSPLRHHCPRCGAAYEDERHYRAWIWRYHLWLSERAIHLALLAALGGEEVLERKAVEIIAAYARIYPAVPNRDNVLGPTHLFFSTYLESIWLAQIVLAASLLRPAALAQVRGVLDPVVRESAQLIGSFDEGWSNRQVWNNTALAAAALWLGEDRMLQHAIEGPHGLRRQLRVGVTQDGLWFEGENYHFFALRGFLLAAELLRPAGVDLYADSLVGAKLGSMYLAPLDTLLPDLTLPARGDAPFGVSVVQRRFAELWELGRARLGDARLAALLAAIYDTDAPPGEDPGLSELAEQEQNRPAERFTREQLGWKALCWMEAEPPEAVVGWMPRSRLLAAHGLAVLRPGGERYVSLECGGAPGGHGHPDLLHLSLFSAGHILADFGTASYVTPSLHWYRSTLAHNAPGRVGVGQPGREGWCDAFEAGERWSWCRARARCLLGEGTAVRRAIAVGPDYVVDVVDVDAPPDVAVDLPTHVLAGVALGGVGKGPSGDEGAPSLGHGPSGHEHGYDTLGGLVALGAPLDRLWRGEAEAGPELVLAPRGGETMLGAAGPGPPDLHFADGEPHGFLVRRASGSGRWAQCYVLRPGTVRALSVEGDAVAVERADGSVDRLEFEAERLRIVEADGTTHTLAGLREAVPPTAPARDVEGPVIACPLLYELPTAANWPEVIPPGVVASLGARHYRRSESPYGAAGPLTARVAVVAVDSRVCIALEVTKQELVFRAVDAPDLGLDNEVSDIHSDGVQCYVGADAWEGYLAVPDPQSTGVRIQAVAGTAADASRCVASWARTADGYRIVVAIDLGRPIRRGERLAVNVVVNEMQPGRERRAGQLALAGGAGWVYLRGDRETPAGAAIAEVT